MTPSPKPAADRYWLLKTEPESFSIDDLAKSPKQTTYWDGVRNYQARNFLRDDMQVGDRVLIYHSNTHPTAIVGTAKVVKRGYPDHTARDASSDYYDAKSTADNPIWYMVDIKLEQIFAEPLPLEMLRSVPALKHMELLRKGSRLSVQPVRPAEFAAILKVAGASENEPKGKTASNKRRRTGARRTSERVD